MATITYDNKSTLNPQPSVANVNKVTSGDMNEIKSVVNTNYGEVGDISNLNTTDKTSVVNAINSMQGTILWTNPNPSASFSGNITLSSNDYDTLEFYFHKGTDDENSIHVVKVIKGYGGQAIISGTGVFSGTTYNSIIRRNIVYNSDTQYNISTALYRYSNSSTYGVSNVLIPIYVIGYKTGLFN